MSPSNLEELKQIIRAEPIESPDRTALKQAMDQYYSSDTPTREHVEALELAFSGMGISLRWPAVLGTKAAIVMTELRQAVFAES